MADSLTKADIAMYLVEARGLGKKEALEIVHDVFELMSDVLVSGSDLKLSGFGTFSLREKKARLGRNPKTGEQAEIDARTVVSFKASGKLKG